MPDIRTPRLHLRPGTPDALRGELESPHALGVALGVAVAAGWPPEFYDADAVRYTLNWLATHPGDEAWSFYYMIEQADEPTIVGAGGYKGAPDEDGTVEIGYSVVLERRRRGYAREAVDGWLAYAFADRRVARVIAHTLTHLVASIGVLRSAGFDFAGPGTDPHEPDAIQYVLPREKYEASIGERHAVVIG
jgi:ribosomal-protein-alanine N-acetyltransferase